MIELVGPSLIHLEFSKIMGQDTLLYYVNICKIIKKMTNPVHCSTQDGGFTTTYTSEVETVLTELDVTKSVRWNFHVDKFHKNHRYDIILGKYIFPNLKKAYVYLII